MIELTLPLPTSLNRTYRTGNGNYYKSQEARDWEEEALYQIMEQHISTKEALEGDIYVGIEMFIKRDRDIDSGLKILLDFMQDKFYINDSQITQLNVKKYKTKDPRVVVTIERLAE